MELQGLILYTEHYYGGDDKQNVMLGHMARLGERCIQDSGAETQKATRKVCAQMGENYDASYETTG